MYLMKDKTKILAVVGLGLVVEVMAITSLGHELHERYGASANWVG